MICFSCGSNQSKEGKIEGIIDKMYLVAIDRVPA